MRCLVTGVAGFVGSHLAGQLLANGHVVHGIDSFTNYYPRQIKERNLSGLRSWNKFTFSEDDLLNINLTPLLEGTDWVFHQAAQAGVRTSWGRDFSQYVDCNILATQRLLEAARNVECIQRFIYASSSSVYGDTTTLPIVESVTPCPVSPYGVSKLAAEQLCSLYYKNFGVPTVSLRYFTVYGPRQRPDMAFHHFCKAVVEHQPIRIYGNGQQTRDFTYIADVVEANIRAATVDATIGKVMNIAGGSRVTLHSVLELLQEISEIAIDVIFEPKQYGDVDHTFADTSRAEQLMGYHPLVSLREGLEQEFNDIISIYANTRSFVSQAQRCPLSNEPDELR